MNCRDHETLEEKIYNKIRKNNKWINIEYFIYTVAVLNIIVEFLP